MYSMKRIEGLSAVEEEITRTMRAHYWAGVGEVVGRPGMADMKKILGEPEYRIKPIPNGERGDIVQRAAELVRELTEAECINGDIYRSEEYPSDRGSLGDMIISAAASAMANEWRNLGGSSAKYIVDDMVGLSWDEVDTRAREIAELHDMNYPIAHVNARRELRGDK